MGGCKGSGEERDNKAGGDVNSQIGSFSCFPQPATLDGWLRQRPERIRETGAPPEGWESGGEGGRWSWLGSVGAPKGCKERNDPRKPATLGETEGKMHKRLTCLLCLQPLGPRDSTRDRRVGVYVPSGLQGESRSFHRGVRDVRLKWAKDWLRILPLSFLHCRFILLSHTPVFPICTSGFISPPLCVSFSIVSSLRLPLLSVTSAAVIGSALPPCLL